MLVKEAVLLVKEEETRVALKDLAVDVEVKDVASLTTITQVYQNTEKRTIEAVYCFPIQEGAAVCAFEIETNGKRLQGAAEERDKAFELYDRAIEAGDASFLLDQETEDILYISVGNIKPAQEVKVSITYVSELLVVDGIIRLQIPGSISPRYAPPGSDPEKVDRITPPYEKEVPYRLSLSVRALSANIAGINCPSHRLASCQEGDYTIISLADDTMALDRDFILELTTRQQREPVCLLAAHDNGERACLFRFYPQFEELPSEAEVRSEVIFVLDCSGSMSGSSIADAKQALELSLRSLSEGDLFNIIRFGSSYEVFSKNPVEYNSSSFNRAIRYLRGIEADLGGTELWEAMSFVCSLPVREGYMQDVLLITDGEVSNPDEIIHLVASVNDKMRVFTFGIGYGPSHHLVKGVARAGGGAYEMIQPGEKIQTRVLRQFSRMSQPFINDISVTFSKAEVQLPKRLPPLFEGDSYTLLARVEKAELEAEVSFRGNYLGKTYSWKARVVDTGQGNSIPSLWALSRIKLLKESAIGGSNQGDRKRKKAEREITDLGLRFNLLTDYTSFVAVEKRKADEKQYDQPGFRRIPVFLTKDWHGIGEKKVEVAGFAAAVMPAPGATASGTAVAYDLMEAKASSRSLFSLQIADRAPFSRRRKPAATSREELLKADSRVSECLPVDREAIYGGKEWYLALLGTQQAEGFFTGLDIVAARLKLPAEELKKLAARLDIAAAHEKVLVTWLSVKLLIGDPAASNIGKRALKKAERWLKDRAGVLTVNGAPLEEHIESEYQIVL